MVSKVSFVAGNSGLTAASHASDTPQYIALAALQSIPVLTDTEKTPFDFMIYTGDLVSHDPDTMKRVSGEYATEETDLPCPESGPTTGTPVTAFHTRTVISRDPDAMNRPSGE